MGKCAPATTTGLRGVYVSCNTRKVPELAFPERRLGALKMVLVIGPETLPSDCPLGADGFRNRRTADTSLGGCTSQREVNIVHKKTKRISFAMEAIQASKIGSLLDTIGEPGYRRCHLPSS